MDSPLEIDSISEALSACDSTTTFSVSTDPQKGEDTNDSQLDENGGEFETERPETEEEDNSFDAEMDEFAAANNFMRTDSPAGSEDLEIEKIMAQLENTINNDVFSKTRELGRSIEADSRKDSESDSEENMDDLNLINEDIISYIDSEVSCPNEINDNPPESELLENSSSDSGRSCEKSDSKGDIIDLINKELEETLQFTDVLCHYIYSDVIVGKDFFKLFCGENVKTDISVVNADAVE